MKGETVDKSSDPHQDADADATPEQSSGLASSTQAKPAGPVLSARDWLQILIAPIILAVIGYVINSTIQTGQREAAAEQARDSALQAFVTSMQDLLIRQNVDTSKAAAANALVHAQAVSVLRELDGRRRITVLRFLHESALVSVSNPLFISISSPNQLDGADLTGINLPGADLNTGADLRDINLTGADLSGDTLTFASLSGSYLVNARLENSQLDQVILNSAHMSGSDLIGAHLANADLTNADLSSAYLTNAQLPNAKLQQAKLGGASLVGANLAGVDFTDADLAKADLSNAVLTGATITADQLNSAKSVQGATLPDGTKQP